MAQNDAASMLVKAMDDKRISFSERRKVAEFLLTYENRNEVMSRSSRGRKPSRSEASWSTIQTT